MKKTVIFLGLISALNVSAETADYTQYVNPLMGTQSSFELSTGNTYPVIARPWGMNFWTPVTGKMGDGWQYTYDAYKIRGFEQTHQPSPWINDYGQFAIMPVTGSAKFNEDDRASWFSHKAEEARPYYYKAYLADHDVVAEMTPTDRAAMFRFTFPENDSSFVVVDAYDRGSAIRIIPGKNRIVGYTTRNSGGVPENFRNYFVVEFDKPFTYCGDEDNGQTSAWYVFSALGFYPVAPGTDQYALGAPLFRKAVLNLENGRKVTINAADNTGDNRYIRDMKVNGKVYDKNYITYPVLMDGAVIEFDMSDKPNFSRGVSESSYPYSFSKEK